MNDPKTVVRELADGARPWAPDREEPPTDEAVAPGLVRADLAALWGAPLPEPGFALSPLLPRKVVTLLAAHGGVGKSVWALTCAAHIAAGAPWAGLPTVMGKAVYVSLEDDTAACVRRLRRIVAAYRLDHRAVLRNLVLLDGTDGDGALAVETGPNRRLVETALMAEVRRQATEAVVVFVDNASEAMAANENERQQVRRFVRILAQMARDTGTAVCLLAHVDKASARGLAGGKEAYSGSTAWHNSARSRLSLAAGKDTNAVELTHAKLTEGRPAEPIRLTWTTEGVLVPAVAAEGHTNPDAAEDLVEASANRADEDAVLAAVRAVQGAGLDVPTASRGTERTTLSVLAGDLPADLRGHSKESKARFWGAIARLERAGALVREPYRTPTRNTRERWRASLSLGALTPPIPPAQSNARK